ncbi:VOC family protein [Nostocoides vanveenii]|uniref:Glyoxalase/fosfomycin resistance/dioxygenase domain-containing protein n=1 Tax=Nostocoides vanveenii TaxID=330835 RepID=A0ABN2K1F9_9MICO
MRTALQCADALPTRGRGDQIIRSHRVTLNPYLTFDGNACEAMAFYAAVLGGDLRVSTFAEFGDPGNEGVMHAQLQTPAGFTSMASDMPPGMGDGYVAGTNISISLSGNASNELRGYWAGLAEGGTVTMPLEKQMWGDEFGMLDDRFGITGWATLPGRRPHRTEVCVHGQRALNGRNPGLVANAAESGSAVCGPEGGEIRTRSRPRRA